MLRFIDYAPIKISLWCVAWMGVFVALCMGILGSEKILRYSEKNGKYYAALFLQSDRNDRHSVESLKIVGLGDSSFFYPPDGGDPVFGKPEHHIPAILESTLRNGEPALDVAVSGRAFRGASMYDYYCMLYEAEKHAPDLVIIPINWTSFGPWWKKTVNANFPELCALAPLYDSRITVEENLVRARNISVLEQIGYKLTIWYVYPFGIKQMILENVQFLFSRDLKENESEGSDVPISWPKTAGKSTLAKMFPMRLSESGRHYLSIRAIANLASKHHLKVLFYITPINLDLLIQNKVLNEKAFTTSKELIFKAARADGVYCIDLSDLLEDEYFPDPSAHYTLDGRKKICDALALAASEILSNESPTLEFTAQVSKINADQHAVAKFNGIRENGVSRNRPSRIEIKTE